MNYIRWVKPWNRHFLICPRLIWHLGMSRCFYTARVTHPVPVIWYSGPPTASWTSRSYLFHPRGEPGMAKMHHATLSLTWCNIAMLAGSLQTSVSLLPLSKVDRMHKVAEKSLFWHLDSEKKILRNICNCTPEYREILLSKDQDHVLWSMDWSSHSRCSQLSSMWITYQTAMSSWEA